MIQENCNNNGDPPMSGFLLTHDWRSEEQFQMIMMQHDQQLNTPLLQQRPQVSPSSQAEVQRQMSIEFQQRQLQDTLQQQQHLLMSQQDQQQPAIAYQVNGNQLTSDADIYHFAFDYATQSANREGAMSETITSTMEEASVDVEILPSDDQFAYLQGLNSDNLMQFSQQSAIQELMIKEQLEVKPLNLLVRQNLNVLPTFEEHDIGGYKFQLNLMSAVQQQRKSSRSKWVYSEAMNKVYLRMNELFSIDAQYTPKSPQMPLRIRAMLTFVKEVSEPVLRCQNHISKDNELQSKKRHSLLRCDNPCAEYCGSDEGKSINDRYSVVIPLSMNLKPNSADNTIKHTIALKFTCQNSCIGRKETSVIFLLESMNGEILSQRVLNVKICSCPKRDKEGDERNAMSTKRKMDEDLYTREPKMQRTNGSSVSPLSPLSVDPCKEERNSSDQEETNSDRDDGSPESGSPKSFDIQRTPSGHYRVVVSLLSRDIALRMLEYASDLTAAGVMRKAKYAMRSRNNCRQLRRLQDKAKAMKF